MRQISVLVFILAGSVLCRAQKICSSSDYKHQLLKANPSLQRSFDLVEQQIKAYTSQLPAAQARDTSSNELINIPVVVHVVYKLAEENISDAQIRSQIDVLNNDFSGKNADRVNIPPAFRNLATDTRIHFCLAQVDPDGVKTNGIARKQTNNDFFMADDAVKANASGGANPWDSRHYLNIWICRLAGRSLGYSTLPGGAADKDGVVIAFDVFGTVGNVRYPFNKGRTATHEIGHWLGLRHIWGDDVCGDDGVWDTPRQKSYNFGCPSFPHVTDCSVDGNGDMFMNFMDFSDDACMNMFTNGQKSRMRALFGNGNIRNSFLQSFACDSSLAHASADGKVADEEAFQPFIKYYPNPCHASILIETNSVSKVQTQQFSIYDVAGHIVLTTVLTSSKSSINISALATGVYILKIGDGREALTAKIIKN